MKRLAGAIITLLMVSPAALADEPADVPAFFTKKISSTQVKVYAKDIVGIGKVQFWVNGREIAWVRAKTQFDPKLRIENSDPYLVRTVNLVPGKNRIEITVDSGRAWFATYSR
jgi:hypothetical protein